MKFRRSVLLAFSIGLGLTGFAPARAATDGEQKIEHSQEMTRGNGGYWLIDTTKISQYEVDPAKREAHDAFIAATGRVPSKAELAAMVSLIGASPNVELDYPAANAYLEGIIDGGVVASGLSAGVSGYYASTVMGPNGNLYTFTNSGMLEIKPDGTRTSLPVPADLAGASHVRAEMGDDGIVNIVKNGMAGVERFDPKTGAFSFFFVPGLTARDSTVTSDRDGNLYISRNDTDSNARVLRKVDPQGNVTTLLTGNNVMVSMDRAGDNLLAITYGGDKIYEFDRKTGAKTELPVTGVTSGLIIDIVQNPDKSYQLVGFDGKIYSLPEAGGAVTVIGQIPLDKNGVNGTYPQKTWGDLARDSSGAIYSYNGDKIVKTEILSAPSGSVDREILAKAAILVAKGTTTVANALAQVTKLADIAKENKNSNYLDQLPDQFLNWSPDQGLLPEALRTELGTGGRAWEPRFTNAYEGMGIDPNTKKFLRGPLAGQTMATNFNAMIEQLSSNGYITMDWDYNTLIADVGGQAVLDKYGQRGPDSYWDFAGNLFKKTNLHDPTMDQRYGDSYVNGFEARYKAGDTGTDWYMVDYRKKRNAGYTPEQYKNEMVRWWMTSDGTGKYSPGVNSWGGPLNGAADSDFLLAANFSTAAKLVAESKALRSLGMAAEADAKIKQARNVILLSGNDHDPLVLDLNHNGKVDVTGRSSSKYRKSDNKRFVPEGSVKFDLMANGKPFQTEWIKGGDGFLVDNINNAALNRIAEGKPLTGANLFGDIEGYPGGFMKLASFFDRDSKVASLQTRLSEGFGVLRGKELDSLMVWVDNGDGLAVRDELKNLAELGITEIGLIPQIKKENEELLEQSYFVQNGKKYVMQEVWFMGK